MVKTVNKLGLITALLFLAACGSTGVIPIGNNLYMVDAHGGSAVQTASRSKKNVLIEAGKYCEARNLMMNMIKMKAYDGIPGQRFPHTELTFECVSIGSAKNHVSPDIKVEVEKLP